MAKKIPVCGNPDCACSTGIHDGLTFGSGELDSNGYWEFPCRVCAEAWDKLLPERKQKEIDEYKAKHPNATPEEIAEHMRWHADYLQPAWPYAKKEKLQNT